MAIFYKNLWIILLSLMFASACSQIKIGCYCEYDSKSISSNCIELLENEKYNQTLSSEGTNRKLLQYGTWKRQSASIILIPHSKADFTGIKKSGDTTIIIRLRPIFLNRNIVIVTVNYGNIKIDKKYNIIK